MSLSLICACGARIDLDDTLAGQDITCPECQQPLKAPASAESQPVRTSAFALASFILSIVGAFTLVGSMAAVVLGMIALIMILRDRERIAGFGFALAGIAIGFFATALTGLGLYADLGFSAMLHERNMAEFIDTTGPLEVAGRGWTITRPTEKWGVAKNAQINDPVADLFLQKNSADLVLVQPRQYAFVDIALQTGDKAGMPTKDFLDQYLDDYKKQDQDFESIPKNKNSTKVVREEGFMRITNGVQVGKMKSVSSLPAGLDSGMETEWDVMAAGQKWTMVVRVYRVKQVLGNNNPPQFYVLRAYTKRNLYKQSKADFDKALAQNKQLPGGLHAPDPGVPRPQQHHPPSRQPGAGARAEPAPRPRELQRDPETTAPIPRGRLRAARCCHQRFALSAEGPLRI
jgi:hypothetical protein